MSKSCQAEAFKSSYVDAFSNDKLLSLYTEEEDAIVKKITQREQQEQKKDPEDRKEIKPWNKLREILLKKIDAKEEDYTKYFPKSIQYVKDNILHSNDGHYYVISYNEEGVLYPREYEKTIFNDVYAKYFKSIIQKWFGIYHKIVHIVVDHLKPQRYTDNHHNYLNLFNGYPYDTFPRDEKIINFQTENINTFWKHVHEVLCYGNTQIFEEVKSWLYALIGGKRKMKTALYFKGVKGAGKSILLHLVSACLGIMNSINIRDGKQIIGEFNGHMAGKLFVSLDDVPLTYEQFAQLYGYLKVPITEPYDTYRDLFKKAIKLKNITSFIICSNHPILKLEASTGEERRYVIADVDPNLRSEDYFTTLWNIVESQDFQKAFYWHCQDNYDPSYNEQVSVKKLPKTETAMDAIQSSMTPIMEFIKTMTEDEIFDNPMKPKDIYNGYTLWYTHQPQYDVKRCKKYGDFCKEMTSFPFITIKDERHNGGEKTNWLKFDKEGCIIEFKKRGFFSKFDDISNNHIEPLLYYENKKQQLLKELEQVESQLKLEIQKRNEEEEYNTIMNEENNDEQWKKRIIFPTEKQSQVGEGSNALGSLRASSQLTSFENKKKVKKIKKIPKAFVNKNRTNPHHGMQLKLSHPKI